MKKIYYLIILIIIVIISGCESEPGITSFYKIKMIEINERKLDNLEISYDDFLNNINNIFTEDFSKLYLMRLRDNYSFSYDGKSHKLNELEAMNEDQLSEMRKLRYEKLFSYFKKSTATIKISKIYNFKDERVIYTKTFSEIEMIDMKNEVWIYKAYHFKKINNEWKISDIHETSFLLDDNMETKARLDEISRSKYSRADVEYIDTIMIEIDIESGTFETYNEEK